MFTLSLFIVCLGNWKDYVRWGIAWWSRCLPQSPFSLLDVVTTLMLLMVMVMVMVPVLVGMVMEEACRCRQRASLPRSAPRLAAATPTRHDRHGFCQLPSLRLPDRAVCVPLLP